MPTSTRDDLIQTRIEDLILRIGINRPDKMNALTVDMYNSITNAIRTAERDESVKVIFIYGQGACFCSGNDIKDFLNNPDGAVEAAQDLLYALYGSDKPVVAAVNGPAVGIGTTMLLNCDLVYAAPSAKFILPFIDLGLCPEGGASYILPRILGYQKTAQMLLLGEPLTVQKAETLGLVNQVVDGEELVAHALAKAGKLSKKSADAVSITRSMIKKAYVAPLKELIKDELKIFRERLSSADCKNAVNAFLKR